MLVINYQLHWSEMKSKSDQANKQYDILGLSQHLWACVAMTVASFEYENCIITLCAN